VYQEAVPFAVVGSNTVIEVRGRKMRGRMYPWGVVEVENPEHCDFIKLRTLLVFVILSAAMCTLLVGLLQQLNTCGFCLCRLFSCYCISYLLSIYGIFAVLLHYDANKNYY